MEPQERADITLRDWSQSTIDYHSHLLKIICYPNPPNDFSQSLINLTTVPSRDDPYPVQFNHDNIAVWKSLLHQAHHQEQLLDLLLDLIPLLETQYSLSSRILDMTETVATNRPLQAELDRLLPYRPYLCLHIIFLLRHIVGDVFPVIRQHGQLLAYTQASWHLLYGQHRKPWLVPDTTADTLGPSSMACFFEIICEAKTTLLRQNLSDPLDFETVIGEQRTPGFAKKLNGVPLNPLTQAPIVIPVLFPTEYKLAHNNDIIFPPPQSAPLSSSDPPKRLITPSRSPQTRSSDTPLANTDDFLTLGEQFELVSIPLPRRLAVALEGLFDLMNFCYEDFPALVPKAERHIPLTVASALITIPYMSPQTSELLITQLTNVTKGFGEKTFTQPSIQLSEEHGSVAGSFLHRFLSGTAFPIRSSPFPSLIQFGMGDCSIIPKLTELLMLYETQLKGWDSDISGIDRRGVFSDPIIALLSLLLAHYVKWTAYRSHQDIRCRVQDIEIIGHVDGYLSMLKLMDEEKHDIEGTKTFYSPSTVSELTHPWVPLEGIGCLTRAFRIFNQSTGKPETKLMLAQRNVLKQFMIQVMSDRPQLKNNICLLILSNFNFKSTLHHSDSFLNEEIIIDIFKHLASTSHLFFDKSVDFMTIDLLMEYLLSSREYVKRNTPIVNGFHEGFEYKVDPAEPHHPNSPHPTNWRLVESLTLGLENYFTAWFAKLQSSSRAIMISNFFHIANFYLRGQMGARLLQYRTIYKNDCKPSKLRFSNVTHYDLYTHPALTAMYKDSSLNLLPSVNEYSHMRAHFRQAHIQVPSLFDTHTALVMVLHCTLQQLIDGLTTPKCSRCGVSVKEAIKQTGGADTAMRLWGQNTRDVGSMMAEFGDDQALSTSYLFFLHMVLYKNFGENLFFIASSERPMIHSKSPFESLPALRGTTINTRPTLHLYLNTLSALHKVIFQPTVIVAPKLMLQCAASSEKEIKIKSETFNPALSPGNLKQHPPNLRRPLYALYVDTLLYILQGYAYSAFELSRKNTTPACNSPVSLVLETYNLHDHSYFQVGSSIRAADSITTAHMLERSVHMMKKPGPGKKPTTTKPRMDSYDYNMARTVAEPSVMNRKKFGSRPLPLVQTDDAQSNLENEPVDKNEESNLIPYTTEIASAMVQFCIESFIDLLLIDEIYDVVSTFDFAAAKALPDFIPLAAQSDIIIPTLDQLHESGVDKDFSGIFVEKGQHRYRDHDATSTDALELKHIKESSLNVFTDRKSSSQKSTYVVNQDPLGAPIITTAKPQHFGFFYALPQVELDAIFKALAIHNIASVYDKPLTTNNGKVAYDYPFRHDNSSALDNLDYIPVFGLSAECDTQHLGSTREDGFQSNYRDLMKINADSITDDINYLVSVFFENYPTPAEFTPHSFNNRLEEHWGGNKVEELVDVDPSPLPQLPPLGAEALQEPVQVTTTRPKQATKPKLFSYLDPNDPSGSTLARAERFALERDQQAASNVNRNRAFVYNDTQSLCPLTSELLMELFETRKNRFKKF